MKKFFAAILIGLFLLAPTSGLIPALGSKFAITSLEIKPIVNPPEPLLIKATVKNLDTDNEQNAWIEVTAAKKKETTTIAASDLISIPAGEEMPIPINPVATKGWEEGNYVIRVTARDETEEGKVEIVKSLIVEKPMATPVPETSILILPLLLAAVLIVLRRR